MMFGRCFLMAVLCVPTVAQTTTFRGSPADAKTVDGAMKIANKVFPCPDAKWSLVEQPFWRHHTVLKLTSCQWPFFRPSRSMNKGYAFLLSDHILIVSAKTPLAQFNAATQAESTFVDAGNVSDYLKFFVTSRLNWSDSLVFGGDSLARKVRELWGESDARRLADQTNDIKATLPTMGNIPVKDDENGHAFKAAVFEWRPNGTPPAMQRHDITIHPDGRIELNSEWIWRTNPESPWTEYSYPRHGFAITLPQARAPEENDENDIAAYDLYWNGSRDEDTQISARLIVNTRTDCASWLIKYRKALNLNPPVTLGDYSMTLDKPIKTHEVTIKGNPAFEGEFSLNVWSRAYFRQQCLNGTLFAFYALWPRSQTKPAIVDGMFDSFRLISSGIKK